jgi:hypothetical protein
MKAPTLAALALLLGAGLASTPASAAPIGPGMTGISADSQLSQVIQVHRRGYHRRGHDRNFAFGLALPLFMGLGYGLGHHRYYDRPYYGRSYYGGCDGFLHHHYNGRHHCHWRY